MTRTLAAAALFALLVVAPARADGDPASDILYGDNVFLSLVSPQVNAKGKVLEELTAAAAQRALPLKVAVVEAPTDLGVVPQLFGRAAEYAKFLRAEIIFGRWKGTLIVVMNGKPGGVAVAGPAAPQASARVALLKVPAHASLDQLGDVAIAAGLVVLTLRRPRRKRG